METEFVRTLSPETKHLRFFGGVNELSPSQIKRFCTVHGCHSMAFVATVRRSGQDVEIGISRYAPNAAGRYNGIFKDTRPAQIVIGWRSG
jgi:acetyltransferase